MNLFKIMITLAVTFAPSLVWAHGGGLDAQGCHTDSSTNTRHCHNSSGSGESSGGSSGGAANTGLVLAVVLVVVVVGVSVGVGVWAMNKQQKKKSEEARKPFTVPLRASAKGITVLQW